MSVGTDRNVPRTVFIVWASLLTLLALTVVVTLGPFGWLKGPASLAIAVLKAGLIVWVYMDVRKLDGILRIAALAPVALLAILAGFVSMDILARGLAT